MKDPFSIWLAVLVLLAIGGTACAEGLEPIIAAKLLAAMPIMERGMTQGVLMTTTTGFQLSVSRVIMSHILVRGTAGTTSDSFNLCVRLLAPLELAPAFLAVELDSKRVTGLMTLFFGPVAIDLGRTWFDPARWAWIQFVVHPRLTMVIGGIQHSERIEPKVGWRVFPTSSAQWEVGMMFGRDGIRLSFGGTL